MARGVPADASSLIYLAKADAFAEASRAVGPLLVPPAVWAEAVVGGERIAAAEVPRIRATSAIRRVSLAAAWVSLARTIAREHRLGAGESEVLALGHDAGPVLLDEGRATRVARALGVMSFSTLFVPLVGLRDAALEEEEALSLLRRLAVVTGARAETVFELEKHLRGNPT